MADCLSYDLCYFFVFVCVLLHGLRHSVFCIIFLLLVLFYIIRWTVFSKYHIIEINVCVILFRCIAKANLLGEDTFSSTCHTISELSASRTSYCQLPVSLSTEACVRARIIPFGFVTQTCQWCRVFPGTFNYPVSILTLVLRTYTMTTVDAT